MEPPRMPPRIGQRHLIIFLLMVGMSIVYMTRVNLSVALVAMVNSSFVTETSWNGPLDPDSVDPSCFPKNQTTHHGGSTASLITSDQRGVFKWTRETQGLVLSSYFWLYALPLIPAGNVAHKWSAKWMFAAGVMLPSVLSVLLPTAARISVYSLMTVRALQGLFESITCPSLAVLLGRWCPLPEASVLYMAANIGALVGTIFGQLTAGFICDSPGLGWASVFYVHAAVSLLWLPAWWLLGSNCPSSNPRISAAEVAYIGVIDENDDVATLVPWGRILRDPATWAFIICMGVRDWLFNTNLSCLPQFLTDVLHLGVATTGYVAAIPYIANLICPLVAAIVADSVMSHGWLSRTNTRKLFTFVGLVGTAACLFEATRVGCRVTPVVTLMVLANTVISFVSGGFMPNAVDLTSRFCGVLLSMSNILSTVACILSPIVADELASQGTLKQWAVVFDIGGGLAVGSSLIFLLFSSGERRSWDNLEKTGEAAPILPRDSASVTYGCSSSERV